MIIDVHHHFLPKRYFENLETLLPPEIAVRRDDGSVRFTDRVDGYTYLKLDPDIWSNAETQLRIMDRVGVEHAVLSAACYQDWMTMDAARIINDGTAEVAARYPDRFSAMISVPPDEGDEMVREIERARDELGCCAVNMTTSHRGRFPDHEDFRPLLKAASELDLPVYVHPSWRGPPVPHMADWNLERSVGKATDLSLSIARLMFAGVFTELPGLRLILAHLGGALPITLRRLFFGEPGYLNSPQLDYKALLERVYVDTAPGHWQSSLDIDFAARKLGTTQIMMGSDFPLSLDPENILRQAVEHLRGTEMSDGDREKIFALNAIAVLKLDRLKPGADPAARCCPDHGHTTTHAGPTG